MLGRIAVSVAAAFVTSAPFAQAQTSGHLSLAQAIDIALENNHDIELARLTSETAAAGVIAAHAARNPTLTLQTANINPAQGIGTGGLRDKTVDTTVRVEQLIERGGKRELRTTGATQMEIASRAELSDARRQLRLSVAQAYYELLAAQEKLLGAQQTVALFAHTAEAARTRRNAGDIAGVDADRIEVDALRAANEARRAEADLANARLTLVQLLGLAPDAVLRATDNWPAVQPPTGVPALEERIERRPDIQAAMARLDATETGCKLARASRTRDVTVGLQYEHWPTSRTNTQGTGNSYGISVQIPLFVRYYYEGEIRAADAARASARQNLEKVRAAANIEFRRALFDLQSAADRVQRFQQQLLPVARKSADAAEFAFRNGAIDVMDVLDARRIYHATQLDAVTAQADYAKSLAAWRAAILEET